MLKKDMEQIEWISYFVTKLIHEDIEHCVSGLQAGEQIFHEYKEVGEEGDGISQRNERRTGI